MKVMLIDDSRTMRNVQKTILAQLGYTDIVEAFDGHDALSKVSAAMPGLILLDWHLPNMDGITFLKEFRKINRDTLVIMVTTESEKSRVVEAIKAGVNSYVVKPFTPEDLSNRIKETLKLAA